MTQQLLTVEELYAEYDKKVYGYVYQRLNDYAVAEDITSDVFAKIVEKISTFDPERASYLTWIFTITKNMVISYYRRKRDTEDIEELQIADEKEDLLDAAIMKESSGVLAEALKDLPEKHRDIMIARYYYDYSFKQIGDMLDMTEAHARVTHGRILKKLKELIGDKL